MKAWAICDTDGGRKKPTPLFRHLYSTKEEAIQARHYDGFDKKYYPVLEVEITVNKGGEEMSDCGHFVRNNGVCTVCGHKETEGR